MNLMYLIIIFIINILYYNYKLYGGTTNNCNLSTNTSAKLSLTKTNITRLNSLINFINSLKTETMTQIQNYYDNNVVTKQQLLNSIIQYKNSYTIQQLILGGNNQSYCNLINFFETNYEYISSKIILVYNKKKIYLDTYYSNVKKIIESSAFNRTSIDSKISTIKPNKIIKIKELYKYFNLPKKSKSANDLPNESYKVACQVKYSIDNINIFVGENIDTPKYNFYVYDT